MDAKPLWLLAELTYRCPLQCPYCSNPLDFAGSRFKQELTTEQWSRVFREAKALGVLQLGLSGGEPLLRPDLESLVASAHQLGLYTSLITSAHRLTQDRLAALKRAGLDHVQISVQAADAELSDRIAGTRAYRDKLAAYHFAKELGFPLTVNVVLHRENLHQVDARAVPVLRSQDRRLRRLSLSGVSGRGRRRPNRSGLLAGAAPACDRRGGHPGRARSSGASRAHGIDLPRGACLARARRQGMTATAIHARGLGKDFGAIRALGELDLEVREAEFFGLLGPNGAGKTTTVHLLATLLRPTRGTARVAGHDVVREDLATRRRSGLVFPETTLDRDLTVEQNLRFAARLWNLPGRVAGPRIDELLAQFGLRERRRDAVRTLSGGMRRALDIARGLLHEPRVLFLDEPTAGLDPRSRRSLWELIQRLRSASGLTVFLTTHYVEEAEPCDRVAVLDRGSLAALGTPAELKRAAGVSSLEAVFLARTGHPLAASSAA